MVDGWLAVGCSMSSPERTSLLVDEYMREYNSLKTKYEKFALVFQVGTFFEFYGFQKPELESVGDSNAKEIARDLNFVLARKGDERTLQAGFPISGYQKNILALVSAGYTVLVYDQSAEPGKDKKHTRELTRVYSPGTDLDFAMTTTNTYVVSIHIEFYDSKNMNFSVGMAVMDCSVSGNVVVHESHSDPSDPDIAIDSLLCFLERYPPREIISSCIDTSKGANFIRKLLPQTSETTMVLCPFEPRSLAGKISDYSTHVSVALDNLLDFYKQHFITFSDTKVTFHDDTTTLNLSGTCAQQLNLKNFLNTSIASTCTAMGKRLLRQRLYEPFGKTNDILEAQEFSKSINDKDAMVLQKHLRDILDIDRLQQRIKLNRYTTQDVGKCCQIYKSALELLHPIVPFKQFDALTVVYNDMDNVFVIDNLLNDDLRIVREGINKELDQLFQDHKGSHDDLINIKARLEEHFKSKGKTKVTLKITEDGLETTKTRAEFLKKTERKLTITAQRSSSYLITSPEITNACQVICNVLPRINAIQTEVIQSSLDTWYKDQETLKVLKGVSSYIANLDIAVLCNKLLTQKRYTWPTIQQNDENPYFEAKNLRHPVVEHINEHIPFTPVQVKLDAKQQGLLLYGMNGAGKSVLLNSVGLVTVLAQAGLPVPADHLVLTPFKRIMTRIAGGDNIMRSLSSFEVEAEEIRSVLHRADNRTLVLGDEICRGTENESATAIVYALLDHLVNTSSLFISATHLHGLVDKVQSDFPTIHVCHTKVNVKPNGDIIYDRELSDGAGPRLYGLEVARAKNFPKSFLETAQKFRDEHQTYQPPKKSKYNSKKVVKNCEYCKYIPKDKMSIPLDVHHINFQCNADEDGFHGHNRKHALHNLVTLCKQCHIDVHKQTLTIIQEQTPKGPQLQFKRADATAVNEDV